jgi:hypothetical protein
VLLAMPSKRRVRDRRAEEVDTIDLTSAVSLAGVSLGIFIEKRAEAGVAESAGRGVLAGLP